MSTKFSQVALRCSFFVALFAAIFVLTTLTTDAQETMSNQNAKTEVAKTANTSASNLNATPAAVPVFTDYKGIRIGMSADEVRGKLDHLKEKGKLQDFFVFSDEESAQVFYDKQGKVRAISITYLGEQSNAPSPQAVLGAEPPAKADGSMHQLKRYPAAGYWVAYSRTAGKKPIITVTMQKMRMQ